MRGCAFWRQNAPRGAARSSGAPETQLARTGGQADGASGAGARAAAVGDRARMSRRGRRRCAAARQLSPRNCHRTLLTCAACRRSALRLSSRHLSKVAHPLPVPALACRLRVACVRFSVPRGWHWSGLRLQSDGRARAEFLDRPPAVDKILEADAAGECSEPPPRCPCSVPHPRSAADSHSAPRDCLGQHRRFQSPCRVSGQCVDAKGRPASTHPCIRACRPHRTRPSHRTAPHPIPPPMPPPHSSFPRPFGARRQPP